MMEQIKEPIKINSINELREKRPTDLVTLDVKINKISKLLILYLH